MPRRKERGTISDKMKQRVTIVIIAKTWSESGLSMRNIKSFLSNA